jgi:hypothetical protein
MATVSQYPHFYQDKEGKQHRNMLQLEAEEPRLEKNFPKDGSVMIRIQDEEAQKAFKMTPQEALQLGTELEAVAKELMEGKRKLWKSKARP